MRLLADRVDLTKRAICGQNVDGLKAQYSSASWKLTPRLFLRRRGENALPCTSFLCQFGQGNEERGMRRESGGM